jgi:glycosyltransferase involved in cell wall biosynthesis
MLEDSLSKVSIITPFYNAEKYFAEAIESVIAQKHTNWELFLIDDGSTDKSTKIAKKYASEYPGKIIYLEHEEHKNKGKSTSRNLGLSKSTGEYIAFLDADDVFLPEKLEKQVNILKNNPEALMVYGPTLYWYSWNNNSSNRDKISRIGFEPNVLVPPPVLLSRFLTKDGIVPCTCGVLVKNVAVKAIEGFDESIQHLYEDQVFFAKICLSGPVYVEDGTWDKYRQHSEMTSMGPDVVDKTYPFGIHISRRIYLEWLDNYVKLHKISNLKLKMALSYSLLPFRAPFLYSFIHIYKTSYRKWKPIRKRLINRTKYLVNR